MILLACLKLSFKLRYSFIDWLILKLVIHWLSSVQCGHHLMVMRYLKLPLSNAYSLLMRSSLSYLMLPFELYMYDDLGISLEK